MAVTPRSTARISHAPGASLVPSTPVALPAFAANTTTNVVITPVSNLFRPGRSVLVQHSAPLDAGVVLSSAFVTGNAGARSITITYGNLTAAPVDPAQTIIGLVQE